ncbi:hypothetical protein ACFY94_13120 [Streptomyces griseorubiginosus]|uniref:hypothetical protein n=1 Tax=Streptomyces griseorubiginosus TaxID=67304 RepID=UPI0036E89556
MPLSAKTPMPVLDGSGKIWSVRNHLLAGGARSVLEKAGSKSVVPEAVRSRWTSPVVVS